MPPPNRTFWQRITAGARRLLPRSWRTESDPDYWGQWISPLDLYDGMKGYDHSVYAMAAAWRRHCGTRGQAPVNQTFSRQHIAGMARVLEQHNPFAQSMLSALRSYVLADQGMSIEVEVREGVTPSGDDEALLTDAQDYLNAVMDANDWWNRQRELYTRCRRDGEGLLRYFRSGDGGVRLRFVEPECVVPPDGSPEWAEGVRTDPDDAETMQALWVQTGTSPADGEEVSADEVYIIKCNVDLCFKRGLSDFASVAGLCMKALDCLTCMISAETERQSIVLVTHHEQSAPADLDAHISAQTDYLDRSGQGLSQGSSREVPVQANWGVREKHLTGAQRLAAMPDPGSIPGAVNAINTAMLAAGSRYHMPQWIVTGDASRNNALDLQAEGPFGRFIADEQAWFARHIRNIMWRVLEIGVDTGELSAETLEALDITVTPQRPTEQRDPRNETDRNLVLFNAGLLGKPTWAAREGLDFEAEQDDLRRYGGPPKPPAEAIPPGYKAMPAESPGTAPLTNGEVAGGK